jgi:hypothetical protein
MKTVTRPNKEVFMIKAAKARKSQTHKSTGRQNKTPQGGRTRFEKQEQGNVTSDWAHPESGAKPAEEEKYNHAAQ